MGKVLKTYPYAITSPYGQRGSEWHGGVDITGKNSAGTHVLDYITAKDKGTVVAVRSNCTGFEAGGSYGNYVMIDHGSGYRTLYAHMAYGSVKLKNGDKVSEGQVIGYMGNTGTSYGGHLHFEVRKNNSRIDPTPYLDKELPLDGDQPAPAPTPSDKFNIGDKVVINGPLYVSSTASTAAGNVSNKITNITRKAPGSAHPYNTTGDLGWMDESSIKAYEEPKPTPEPEKPRELGVGDTVKIVGTGNGSSYGGSNVAYGLGWTRTILKIWNGRPFPYQVGNETGTTGFYPASSLQRL